MTMAVHVDDVCAVEEKTRCDQFGRTWIRRDLDRKVPVKNLGALRWC